MGFLDAGAHTSLKENNNNNKKNNRKIKKKRRRETKQNLRENKRKDNKEKVLFKAGRNPVTSFVLCQGR